MQRVTEEEYLKALGNFPYEIEWEKLADFEQEDTTTPSQEFTCVGDKCMLTA